MSRLFYRVFGLVILGALLSACQLQPVAAPGPSTPTTAPSESNATESNETEASAPAAPLAIPTPAAGRAVVHGIFLREVQETPISEANLYLAEIIPSDNADLKVAGLDTTTAPHAITNANGEFIFTDVEPGEYALAFVTPIGSALVPDPNNPGKDVRLKLEAEQVVDLGTLYMMVPY